jgi:hypothetical protein
MSVAESDGDSLKRTSLLERFTEAESKKKLKRLKSLQETGSPSGAFIDSSQEPTAPSLASSKSAQKPTAPCPASSKSAQQPIEPQQAFESSQQPSESSQQPSEPSLASSKSAQQQEAIPCAQQVNSSSSSEISTGSTVAPAHAIKKDAMLPDWICYLVKEDRDALRDFCTDAIFTYGTLNHPEVFHELQASWKLSPLQLKDVVDFIDATLGHESQVAESQTPTELTAAVTDLRSSSVAPVAAAPATAPDTPPANAPGTPPVAAANRSPLRRSPNASAKGSPLRRSPNASAKRSPQRRSPKSARSPKKGTLTRRGICSFCPSCKNSYWCFPGREPCLLEQFKHLNNSSKAFKKEHMNTTFEL